MMRALCHWTNSENAKTVRNNFVKKRPTGRFFICSKFRRGNRCLPKNYTHIDMCTGLHIHMPIQIRHDTPIGLGLICEYRDWLQIFYTNNADHFFRRLKISPVLLFCCMYWFPKLRILRQKMRANRLDSDPTHYYGTIHLIGNTHWNISTNLCRYYQHTVMVADYHQ